MIKLSFNGKRAVLGTWFLVCLLCVANFYFNLGMVGRFGKQAVIICFIVLAMIQHYIGPSLSEVREYRDRKRRTNLPRT